MRVPTHYPGDPRGFEMESEMLIIKYPYRSSEDEERIQRESCKMVNGFQVLDSFKKMLTLPGTR